jgi:hypothetical protein
MATSKSFQLKSATRTTWNITSERKRVGFVRLLESGANAGKYVARIGNDAVVIKSTCDEAFRQAAAVALGFSNPVEVAQHNRVVTHNRREQKQRVQHVLDEMLRGNYEPFGDMLDKMSE